MAKTIKSKAELGVNSISDSILMPDGFARVCDGVDLRSGVAKAWPMPALSHALTDGGVKCIWEYRGLWHYSDKVRTYHGEYINGQEVVYFTEEGPDHLPPQMLVDGVQVQLGIRRPIAKPLVTTYDNRYPTSLTVSASGSGSIQVDTTVSYRVAAMVKNTILVPCGASKYTVADDPKSVKLEWRKVLGADGYAIFGRTSGSEKLLIKLGNVDEWTDDGTATEGSAPASTYDVGQAYQYVYTYYRKIGSIEEESGPSPISVSSDASTTPVITRLPAYDGLYADGATTFQLSTYNMTATVPASALKTVDYAVVNDASSATMMVTDVAHEMTTGTIGRISGDDADYAVSVPTALIAPLVSFTAIETTGGALPAGDYEYKFTAVRGTVDYYGDSNPAQTTATTVSVSVPSGSTNQVRFTIDGFSSGTHAILVYRDDVPLGFWYPTAVGELVVGSATWVDAASAWPTSLSGVTCPTVNETATRCFSIPTAVSLTAGDQTTYQVNNVLLEFAGSPEFEPSPGDVINLSGLNNVSEINGACKVISGSLSTCTVQRFLSTSSSGLTSTAGKMLWKPNNGYISGWRIYRVGDTAEFLRVAQLDLSVETYVDLVSTDSLGEAIPSAYDSNGLYVVYDKPPVDLKRMVNHYGMRFGISGNLVRWTPAGEPGAWPDVYYAALPSRPVALQSYKNILAVLCVDGLYGLVGNTPSTMSVMGPMSNLGCIAPFTAIASNYGLMWLSKVGVVISQDGMSASCLTTDRVPGRYFYSPSTMHIEDGVQEARTWYLPPTQSVQFAESMREEQVNHTMYPVTEVTNDLPINAELLGISAYFWDNRYCIYYPDGDTYARSGVISIDMSKHGLPMTTLPLRPLDAHVTAGGDLYFLMGSDMTVRFETDGNGTLSGDTEQTVAIGGSTTPVEAIANNGYAFVDWSTGSTDNPIVIEDVQEPMVVTANFEQQTIEYVVQTCIDDGNFAWVDLQIGDPHHAQYLWLSAAGGGDTVEVPADAYLLQEGEPQFYYGSSIGVYSGDYIKLSTNYPDAGFRIVADSVPMNWLWLDGGKFGPWSVGSTGTIDIDSNAYPRYVVNDAPSAGGGVTPGEASIAIGSNHIYAAAMAQYTAHGLNYNITDLKWSFIAYNTCTVEIYDPQGGRDSVFVKAFLWTSV